MLKKADELHFLENLARHAGHVNQSYFFEWRSLTAYKVGTWGMADRPATRINITKF